MLSAANKSYMLSVVMLSVDMLRVVMLSVVMLSVVMLNVVASGIQLGSGCPSSLGQNFLLPLNSFFKSSSL